jgi:hypothetical protein
VQQGGNLLTWPNRDLPIHAQFGWASAEVGTAPAVFTVIEFRRIGAPWYPTDQRTTTVTMDLSVGPNAAGSFSTTSAANRGATQRVFSGAIWNVASFVALPFQTDPTGTGVFPPVPIPVDPALENLVVFEQSLLLHRIANPLGALPIFSNEWRIGSGRQPAVDTVFRFRDTSQSPIGQRYLVPQAPIVRLR